MRYREYIGIAVCVIASFCLGMFFGHRVLGNEPSTGSSDTITITNTIMVDKPVVRDSFIVRNKYVRVPIIKDSVLCDTLVVHDSVDVEIPITQKHYADSTYEAWVSGYIPLLDSIKVHNQYKQITIREKQKRWGIGLQVGYGVTPKNAQPYIGIGIHYNLFSF